MDLNILYIILAIIAVVGIVIFGIIWYFLQKTKPLRDFAKQAKEAQKEIEAEEKLKEAREARRQDLTASESVQIVDALGGKENIDTIRQCAIRIRVQLFDYTKASESQLKKSGVSGVIKTGKSWQLIVGDRAQMIVDQIEQMRKERS